MIMPEQQEMMCWIRTSRTVRLRELWCPCVPAPLSRSLCPGPCVPVPAARPLCSGPCGPAPVSRPLCPSPCVPAPASWSLCPGVKAPTRGSHWNSWSGPTRIICPPKEPLIYTHHYGGRLPDCKCSLLRCHFGMRSSLTVKLLTFPSDYVGQTLR